MSIRASSLEGTHTILVVEDDPALRRLLVRRLVWMGHVVAEVPHGEAAVQWLATHPLPSLICLDLSLPAMSGFQLCEKLRAHHQTRFVPILVVTGRTSLQDHTLALEVGVDGFLEKPFRWPQFEDAVVALLRTGVRDRPDEGGLWSVKHEEGA